MSLHDELMDLIEEIILEQGYSKAEIKKWIRDFMEWDIKSSEIDVSLFSNEVCQIVMEGLYDRFI